MPRRSRRSWIRCRGSGSSPASCHCPAVATIAGPAGNNRCEALADAAMARSLSRPLRLGTRGSPLALAQAHMVADALRSAHGWDEAAIELVPITTSGDRIQDRPLAE